MGTARPPWVLGVRPEAAVLRTGRFATEFATDVMTYTVSLSRLTLALSDALDLVGVDVVQHGKRVALFAVECGRELGWSETELRTLCFAALLHDCGVSSTEVHRKLVGEFDWEESNNHCERGFELLRGVELFRPIAAMIRNHHTPWPRLLASDVSGDAALRSNCLFLADRVDAFLAQLDRGDQPVRSGRVLQAIDEFAKANFAPELVGALRAVAGRQATWFTLEPHHLERYLVGAMAPFDELSVGFEKFRAIADLFAEIVDFKSPSTEQHSRRVARLARLLAELHGLPEGDMDLIEVAGLLHDLGKLRVPDGILDKPGPLTRGEGAAMARHPFETYQILSRLDTVPDLAPWAAFHHEALNGTGYPFRLTADRLPVQARIVAVADVVQSLVQDRPYRRPLSRRKIQRLLRHMARAGKLDPNIVQLVATHEDACIHAAAA